MLHRVAITAELRLAQDLPCIEYKTFWCPHPWSTYKMGNSSVSIRAPRHCSITLIPNNSGTGADWKSPASNYARCVDSRKYLRSRSSPFDHFREDRVRADQAMKIYQDDKVPRRKPSVKQ